MQIGRAMSRRREEFTMLDEVLAGWRCRPAIQTATASRSLNFHMHNPDTPQGPTAKANSNQELCPNRAGDTTDFHFFLAEIRKRSV